MDGGWWVVGGSDRNDNDKDNNDYDNDDVNDKNNNDKDDRNNDNRDNNGGHKCCYSSLYRPFFFFSMTHLEGDNAF